MMGPGVRGFQIGYVNVKYMFTELSILSRSFQTRHNYSGILSLDRSLCSKPLSVSAAKSKDNEEFTVSKPLIPGEGNDRNRSLPKVPENAQTNSEVKVYYFKKPKKLLTTDAENFMRSLLEAYPQLDDLDNGQLVKYLEYMSSFGFQIGKAAEMAIKYPPILDNYEKWLMNSIQALRLLGLTERQQKKMLARYPELLTFPRKVISSRANFLKSYFTNEELLTLVENNLSVFSEHQNIVERKLKYLIKSASHTSESVSKSTAISYPLQFIKTRHEFLIRAGLFEVIPYQKFFKVMAKINHKVSTAPGGKKFRERYFNPTEVVCLNDDVFVKVCTNKLLTVNELVAFEEAFALEHEEDNDEEEDDYSESAEIEEEENDEFENENNEQLSTLRNSTGYFTDLENKDFYY